MTPKPVEPDMSSYAGRCGQRMRELRLRSKLSAHEVAKVLSKKGIRATYGAVYRWERGESDPPLNALPILAEIYGLSYPIGVLSKT